MASKLHTLRSPKNHRHFNKASAGVGILFFAIVGTILLFNSHAATPFASIEPEQGTKTVNVGNVVDTTASGGSAVQFGPGAGARWAGFNHRFGFYVVNDKYYIDQAFARQPAFSYSVLNHIWGTPNPPLTTSYIDGAIADKIYYYYQQGCGGTPSSPTPSCQLSQNNPSLMNNFLADTQNFINSTKDNPAHIGYYAIDDTPGNVSDMLVAVHTQIRQSAPSKPMLCGIGGNLDYKDSPTEAYKQDAPEGLEQALTNMDLRACDIAAVYLYSLGRQYADWTMASQLPRIRQQLINHDWDPSTQSLIGVPQAFGWPGVTYTYTPTAVELAVQIESFCQAGYIGIAPFAWKTVAGYDRNEPYLAYDPVPGNDNTKSIALAQGISDGFSRCQTFWNTAPN